MINGMPVNLPPATAASNPFIDGTYTGLNFDYFQQHGGFTESVSSDSLSVSTTLATDGIYIRPKTKFGGFKMTNGRFFGCVHEIETVGFQAPNGLALFVTDWNYATFTGVVWYNDNYFGATHMGRVINGVYQGDLHSGSGGFHGYMQININGTSIDFHNGNNTDPSTFISFTYDFSSIFSSVPGELGMFFNQSGGAKYGTYFNNIRIHL